MRMKKIIILIFGLMTYNHGVAQSYTLEQLKDSALCHNIQIRNVQHDMEIARQQRKEAFTKYFPNISGTGLWFNANRGMMETSITPSEVLPSSLDQMLPAEGLALLAEPVHV